MWTSLLIKTFNIVRTRANTSVMSYNCVLCIIFPNPVQWCAKRCRAAFSGGVAVGYFGWPFGCERWGMNHWKSHYTMSLYHNSSLQSPDSLFKGKTQQPGVEIKMLESKKCLKSLFLLKRKDEMFTSFSHFCAFWHDQHRGIQSNSVWCDI